MSAMATAGGCALLDASFAAGGEASVPSNSALEAKATQLAKEGF